MLTFLVFLSMITSQISANAVDAIIFDTMFQNAENMLTNQYGEPCIKFSTDSPTGGVVYCKSPNDEPRKCTEITSNIPGDTRTAIVCTPPVQTQIDSAVDNNADDDCSVCAVELKQTMEQEIKTINQRIDQLLNKINNLHISPSITGPAPDGKPAATPAPTEPILYQPITSFDLIWKFMNEGTMDDRKLYSIEGKHCLSLRDPETKANPEPVPVIYCKFEDDLKYAHSCKRDPNTNEIICLGESQQSIGDAAAVLSRTNDNSNGYKSTNDSAALEENLKMSLISMWVVLALIVVGNAIFIWCYMKRNKQRKFDLE